MQPSVSGPRPLSLVLAAVGTAAASVFMLVMAVLTLLAASNTLSAGIAAVLVLWALVLGWASLGLARGRRWARGPVVAAGLLHLASFANFIGSQPLAIVPTLVALATVIAAVWPSTTRALHFDERDA